jgi:GTPase SAR1 family protein
MAKDWMKALNKLEGAVAKEANPFAAGVRSPSPSLNFTFGNTHLLPQGYTLIMWGPPAGGKSILCNAFIGQLHKDDLDAIAVKFNTELREEAQNTKAWRELFGIDDDRYIAYDVNNPEFIFDRVEKEIAALCQEGAPIKLIIIDSINAIQGRRAMNAETIMTQQIGDLALTLQEGFKWILEVQRKYKIAVILTSHVRAEMDAVEQMRGNKTKMAAAFGVQHYGEYFMQVEQNRSKAGNETLLGEKLEDESQTDLMDKAERTGHKIRVKMTKSSLGPKMRVGEFTFDYHRGIINTHEEVFLLGVNRNVIEHPNNTTYVFGDKKWVGKPSMLKALQEEPELSRAVLAEIKRRDMAGFYASEDAAAEQAEIEAESTEQSA